MPARFIDQPGLAARCALRAIRAYQRHLSPRKGFCCALRASNGGRSCSAYGYRVIARCGLRKGWRLLRRRLDACGQQHRFGGGPLSYQQGSIDLGCPVEVCDCCSTGCDLGSWWNEKKKQKTNNVGFEALRARVEEAKRRNARED
jgi:putative component of membrane protein insertase Oxa1/YidC/SpoIIIJ protein YidD